MGIWLLATASLCERKLTPTKSARSIQLQQTLQTRTLRYRSHSVQPITRKTFTWNGKVPQAAPSARAVESVMTVRETANASKDTRANRARSRTPWQHRATLFRALRVPLPRHWIEWVDSTSERFALITWGVFSYISSLSYFYEHVFDVWFPTLFVRSVFYVYTSCFIMNIAGVWP